MRKMMRFLLLGLLTVSLASCGGRQRGESDDLMDDGAAAPADNLDSSTPAPTAASAEDEFAEFDDATAAAPAEGTAEPAADQAAATPAETAGDDELSLDDDAPPEQTTEIAEPAPEGTPAEPAPTELAAEPMPVPTELTMPEEPQAKAEPAPVDTTPMPAPVAAPSASSDNVTITSVKYKANDNGGTVLIEANGPISYTTRSNPELHQLIIEVPNAILPKKLQRPLNTRDIQGSIGAIDPYQSAGSNVARFVVQLRDGSPEPVVQQEGNALLVVANAAAPAGPTEETGEALTRTEGPVNVDMNNGQILASQSLSEYLAGNTKFYGKKVSIEMNNMEVRDALRFITEESGVNMVIAEEVKGTISLKLRQVPWDQALVMIMRAKRLGYTRQGNVLRIAPVDQLKLEEEDATKLALSKKVIEPLKVRMFPISYAQVAELEKKVVGFLGERGKVVGDVRTNSLVVTDIEENLVRIAKLVQSLDLQPPQVLIEGKIVEAKESFQRRVGINWGINGGSFKIGDGQAGPVNMRPALNLNPTTIAPGPLNFNLTMGTFDNLGDLTAALALNEKEDKVKVISAPRIVTLTNETAFISQTNEVPVQTVTQNGTATSTSFSFKPLTLRLDVTPQITSDASIIMKVSVKREFRGATVVAGESEAFSVNAREANTRVLVKNGQTAVIGGIYQSDVAEGSSGVPYLREIPFLGALFRGRTTDKEKSELLVFLTPRVLAPMETGNAPATSESEL